MTEDETLSQLAKAYTINRRSLMTNSAIAGGGLLLGGSAEVGENGSTLKTNGKSSNERNGAMGDDNLEPNLRADDPALSPRIRELIRIGENGIARENKAVVAKFFHPEFRFHGPRAGTLTREQLWDYFAACRAAFDDFAVTRQQAFSDGGDHVAARTTFSGVFARPFTASPLGTLQPHGKPFLYKINNIFRYAKDGRLIEEWTQSDSRLILESLGVKLVAAG